MSIQALEEFMSDFVVKSFDQSTASSIRFQYKDDRKIVLRSGEKPGLLVTTFESDIINDGRAAVLLECLADEIAGKVPSASENSVLCLAKKIGSSDYNFLFIENSVATDGAFEAMFVGECGKQTASQLKKSFEGKFQESSRPVTPEDPFVSYTRINIPQSGPNQSARQRG